MSFVFFDTETTGLKRGFDQILHFAAIRTDADLNEIARFETRSRLLPHVLPHPSALRTNGLPIERLVDPSLPSHYAMVKEIQKTLLAWSPAVFVGFNSIRFDEEMLRHALFQCLFPAFLTSNHRNCRADALSLVMAADAVSPAQLVVPLGDDGRRTFRLGALATANGVAHGHAHDAMSDVLATLDLCRLVFQRSPELWQRFVRFSNKASVADFVEAEDGFVLTEFFGGQAYHTAAVCIGRDPGQPNGRLCLNVGEDVERLSGLSDADLLSRLSEKPSPIRRLRINAAPTLTALFDAPVHMLNGASIDDIERRASWVRDDPSMRARLVTAASREQYPLSPHIEERVYSGGFPKPNDQARMIAFHDFPWDERVSIVESFDDERLRWFGLRLIYFEARQVLPATLRTEVENRLADQLTGDGTGPLTYEIALAETSKLLETSIDPNDLLSQYHCYLQERSARVAAFKARSTA
ncbi:exonuclease domain-containing protein [Tardiphaga sp.]|jgi:exodeoxyribonuclease-1|uniref:exonuclease domain-containing protein n=1 Tax=Tardiphaga sp. TaxID=1926292 RepID=UPI0037D9BD6F